MQIELNTLDDCKYLVNYSTAPSEVELKREEVANMFRKAPVPGNRPGKAPISAVKIYYRSQIEESLKTALSEEAFHNTLFQKSLKSLGAPELKEVELKGDEFKCSFVLYTKPEITLTQYKGLEVVRNPSGLSDISNLVQNQLQTLRVKYGNIKVFTEEDFVQFDDQLFVDFEVFLDGEKLENLTATNQLVIVGKGKINEFDTNLIGLKVGAETEFKVYMPEGSLPSLENKVVDFKVKILNGYKVEPLALNDELGQKLSFKNLDDLTQALTNRATQLAENEKVREALDGLAVKLTDVNDFPLPEWLIEAEAAHIASLAGLNFANLKEEDKDSYKKQGVKNLKLSLIIDKIRELEPEAQLTDPEVFNMVKKYLMVNENVQEKDIKDTMNSLAGSGKLQLLMARVKDEYALEFLSKHTTYIQ